MNHEKPVTNWKLLLVLLGVLALFLTGVAWSVCAGGDAKEKAASVESKLAVYAAHQNGTLKTIDTRLKQICDRQREICKDIREQRKMIEDLWKTRIADP